MRKLPGLLSVVAAAVAAAPAQSTRPAYEAAEIKASSGVEPGSHSRGTQGQVLMTGMTMRRLIERALSIKPNQLEGPDWLDAVRFDIAAKYPSNATDADRPRMLLTLIEDRFGLATHTVTREVEGYALTILKRGLKATPGKEGTGTNSDNDGKRLWFKADGATMPDLADYLARRLNTVVADRTGLTGFYSFEMSWTTASDASKTADADPTATLLDKIQDQLQSNAGLRLQPAKVPLQVYVIDRLNRTPRDQ